MHGQNLNVYCNLTAKRYELRHRSAKTENMDLSDKSQLIKYLKENNLWAKKSLSQNFLIDRSALEKIVEAAELVPPLAPPTLGGEGDFVIEIGPGLGVLTQELVKKAGHVLSIELDQELAKLLCNNISTTNNQQSFNKSNGCSVDVGGCKLIIINMDVLKLNLNEVIGSRPYKVVANIPYHITSKILELFLSREHKPELMVLLVQKEVAERVCAKPGDMSVLSVSVQLYGEPSIVGVVPKESFFPSPKVDSAILKVDTTQITDNSFDEKSFFRLVHIGFASRRKTLANNLSAGYALPRERIVDIIKATGLKETVRAQELSLENWKRLLEIISSKP